MAIGLLIRVVVELPAAGEVGPQPDVDRAGSRDVSHALRRAAYQRTVDVVGPGRRADVECIAGGAGRHVPGKVNGAADVAAWGRRRHRRRRAAATTAAGSGVLIVVGLPGTVEVGPQADPHG